MNLTPHPPHPLQLGTKEYSIKYFIKTDNKLGKIQIVYSVKILTHAHVHQYLHIKKNRKNLFRGRNLKDSQADNNSIEFVFHLYDFQLFYFFNFFTIVLHYTQNVVQSIVISLIMLFKLIKKG